MKRQNARTEDSRDRGVSPVVGAVTLVAIVVILAAFVGTFVLNLDTREPAPTLKTDPGEVFAHNGSDSDEEQYVRLSHSAGDSVEVSNLELLVEFSNSSKKSRLVKLPPSAGTLIDPENIEGDAIFDESTTGVPSDSVLHPGTDDTWTASETLEFQISQGDLTLYPGDEITVTIVHTPSNTIIDTTTITVQSDE